MWLQPHCHCQRIQLRNSISCPSCPCPCPCPCSLHLMWLHLALTCRGWGGVSSSMQVHPLPPKNAEHNAWRKPISCSVSGDASASGAHGEGASSVAADHFLSCTNKIPYFLGSLSCNTFTVHC